VLRTRLSIKWHQNWLLVATDDRGQLDGDQAGPAGRFARAQADHNGGRARRARASEQERVREAVADQLVPAALLSARLRAQARLLPPRHGHAPLGPRPFQADQQRRRRRQVAADGVRGRSAQPRSTRVHSGLWILCCLNDARLMLT